MDDKEKVLNFVKQKVNNVEFDVLEYEDNGKTIKMNIYLKEDEMELFISVNRRKDGYRIVSMG